MLRIAGSKFMRTNKTQEQLGWLATASPNGEDRRQAIRELTDVHILEQLADSGLEGEARLARRRLTEVGRS